MVADGDVFERTLAAVHALAAALSRDCGEVPPGGDDAHGGEAETRDNAAPDSDGSSARDAAPGGSASASADPEFDPATLALARERAATARELADRLAASVDALARGGPRGQESLL
jgi:hypothetical protein